MFTLADNREIGRYLAERIKKEFKSDREFVRMWIQTEMGRPAAGEEEGEGEDEVQRRANRLSQIKNGSNSVQLYDLPAFTLLLDISCEELLSAGKCRTPFENRLTNCFVARTNDEGVWKAYAERPDAPILNLDEYGKNIIEYALEFENYGLLSYLMEQDYIYFVGPR